MNSISRIARKELAAFFSSPAAFIFFGVFLGVGLFVFFWIETFFARNIADVRPLFEWMPVLLIFLVAALTMRVWSEERRMGTIEFLLTSPVGPSHFVLGKFLACMALVAIALVLTLPVPVTVALLGPLDWGPVVGAYLATLLLAAAYTSIGLCISARTDNQIVSLITTVLVCGLFYLLGSDALTSLFGNEAGEFLKLLGTGARFESITRGVIDLRDLYYYASILGVFLTLNLFSLEQLRWSEGTNKASHRRWRTVTALVVVNLVIGNLWLQQIGWVRADITQGSIYSISDTTRNYLARLREPLLIRGYFSAQTHPLLAPLVPRLRDLLREYAVASDGKVRVEFIDPMENPELEEEANRKYGIRSVPFQTTSKYQAAVTNSYFDILIQYGDQFETLGYGDLIEVKAKSGTDYDVELRNPEYDITRSIKKVLYGYQGSGDLFLNIQMPVTFTGYLSPDAELPDELVETREVLDEVLGEIKRSSDGKFDFRFVDPDAKNGALAKEIGDKFGFRPMAMGFLDPNTFWFYMTLEAKGRIVQVPLPETLDEDSLRRTIEAGLKRFATGFLKTVAILAPAATPPMPQFGIPGQRDRFAFLRRLLRGNMLPKDADLANGRVPEDADILLVLSPDKLDDKQLFATDQFLMKGGTVVLATSPFDISMQGTLSARKLDAGLAEWLKHNGITIEETMVLDPQNSAFPVPMQRNLGGFSVREIQMLDYPYFADVRGDGLNSDSGLTSDLGQVTLSWASPIRIDEESNKDRKVVRLLESSEDSWTSDSLDIQPDFSANDRYGFPESDERGRNLLAVAVEGRFDSFFKDRPSPLLEESDKTGAVEKNGDGEKNEEGAKNKADKAEENEPVFSNVIDRSAESARIILFASNTFLTDDVLNLAASANRARYLNPIQLIENAIDWSLEDRGLLSIRSRGHFARTLEPLARDAQMLWEYLNYALALVGLLVVYGFHRWSRLQARRRYEQVLNMGRA